MRHPLNPLFPRLQKKDQTSGFTLLEILVVVIIIGILAAIAAPSWFSYLMGRRVVSVQGEIRQALEQAQTEATSRRQVQVVTFHPADDTPAITRGVSTRNASGVGAVVTNGTKQTLGGSSVRPGMLTLTTRAGTGGVNSNPAIAFDHRGVPISPTNHSETIPMPYVITVTPTVGGGRTGCVIVTTLVGNIRTLNNNECTTFTP